MKQLPLEFTKYGHHFKQVTRGRKKAIYHQTYAGRHIAYEVVKIRYRGRRINSFTGELDPRTERYPVDEDWGTWAWSIVDREKAFEKYNSL